MKYQVISVPMPETVVVFKATPLVTKIGTSLKKGSIPLCLQTCKEIHIFLLLVFRLNHRATTMV